MGFFSRLFSSRECIICGSSDTYVMVDFSEFKMVGCRSCQRFLPYGKIPICRRCGKPQTGATYNDAHCPVPKCPNCGKVWDGDEAGWADIPSFR